MNSRIVDTGASRHFVSMRYFIGFLWAGTSIAGAQPPEVESVASPSEPAAWAVFADPDFTIYALTAVFGLTFLLTFYVGVLYFRERRRIRDARAVVLEPSHSNAVRALNSSTLPVPDWQQRAVAAEALAHDQAVLLREKLMPELTEFVKQSLVQGLAAQRDALLAMQQQALQSLLEMETRLAGLHAPLQERIRAYETRIAELEQEISQQGAEMRELTRTILQLMRQKLEDEQGQVQPEETFR